MGCARDIVERARVPRFYWSDFPLGNSAGKPFDLESQRATLAGALALIDSTTKAGTTAVSPQRWAESDDWQTDFLNIDALSEAEIERLREEFIAQKQVANRLK